MALSETKVGLFVLVALGGMGWLSTQSNLLTSGVGMRDMSSTFEDASGLFPGTKVKISGVDIGEVKTITLDKNGRALVTFHIDENVTLPQGVQTRISSNGLIGEKFIALSKPLIDGNGNQLAAPLSEDVTSLPSTTAAAPENIATDFAKIAADLESITSSLKVALGGPENAAKISKIVNGLSAFSEDLGTEGTTILADAKSTMAALKNVLAGNEQAAGNMIKNFSETAENMAKITARLERGEGTLGKLLTGDEFGGDMFAEFSATAKELRTIGEKINSGQGTLGKLVNDPETAQKLNRALDTFGEVTARLDAFKTEVDFNAFSLTNEDRISKGHLGLRLSPRPTRYYQLGVTTDGLANSASGDGADPTNPYFGNHYGEEVKFTAQFGHVYQNALFGQDVGFRLGLKESTGGIGLDTRFEDVAFGLPVDVSADVYDFSGENSGREADNPHVDLKAKVGINRTFYGLVGYDNLLNQEVGSPILGLGFRFQDDDLKYLVGNAL